MVAVSMMMRGLAFAGWACSFRAVPLETPAGASIRWDLAALGQKPLALRVYESTPAGQPSPERLRMAVVNAMRSWDWALGHRLRFDVWMGGDPKAFTPGFVADEKNVIFWRSDALGQGDQVAQSLTSSQAAYTKVYFDEVSGKMQGFDLALNDAAFRFVSRHDVATGQAQPPKRENSELYLEDTVLHELGHALGLDHSLDPASVLYPTSRLVGQLGCDDLSSVRSLYSDALTSPLAELSGTVRFQGGQGVYGVGVMAVHQQNPSLRALTSTRPSGAFSFKGLVPGRYALYAYPQSHLARYFVQKESWHSHLVCSNPTKPGRMQLFPAQWLSNAQGRIQWVQTTTSAPAQVRLNLECDLSKTKVPAVATPRFPVRLMPRQDENGRTVWTARDHFRNRPADLPNELRHYTWTHPGGPLSLHWMSDVLGSEHSARLMIWTAKAEGALGEPNIKSEPSPETWGMQYLHVENLAAGDYVLGVQRSSLRKSKQGLLGDALPWWSYFFWMHQGGERQSCARAPVRWPSYEAPTPAPPPVESQHSRGCRADDTPLSFIAGVFVMLVLGWRRGTRRGAEASASSNGQGWLKKKSMRHRS